MSNDFLTSFLTKINDLVWGVPLLILLVGTGIYFTLKLKFIQVTKLKLAFKSIFAKDEDSKGEGDVSSFGALCTALSSTIGTGNIVGVATAIVAGGPGAMFWMWVAAFFGMTTKFAEGVLAIKYRVKRATGEMAGGPMYYIEKGMGKKWLAIVFAICALSASLLGAGSFTQIKAISDSAYLSFNIPVWASALIVTFFVGLVTLGGIKRISKASEAIVPAMAAFYIIGVLFVLGANFSAIPEAFKIIFISAFNPKAALGGAAGITIMTVMQKGISRGVFSNEAGLGSAPIAAATAKTNSPVKQGLISMTCTFIDTIIICTMTGLAIVITGSYNMGLDGSAVTTYAFESAFPVAKIGTYIVNIGLIFFAFTTILGWNYYGEKCVQYIAGDKAVKPYKFIFIAIIAIGPFVALDTVFLIADISNGLMAIPNLIALVSLRHVVIAETEAYFKNKSTVSKNAKHRLSTSINIRKKESKQKRKIEIK